MGTKALAGKPNYNVTKNRVFVHETVPSLGTVRIYGASKSSSDTDI